jgi:hypothetical protein
MEVSRPRSPPLVLDFEGPPWRRHGEAFRNWRWPRRLENQRRRRFVDDPSATVREDARGKVF